MTTQEKIEVLEYAHRRVKTAGFGEAHGICLCIFEALPVGYFNNHQGITRTVTTFLQSCDMTLPPQLPNEFCWELTIEGDEQRRAFLREHIERLKKEL